MKLLVVSGRKSFDKFKPAVRKAAGFLAKEFKQDKTYLEVYLVGSEFMDKNVLSFTPPKGFPRPDIKLKPLGEIYLNPDFIAKDPHWPPATSYALRARLVFMFIHGFLHLLGYDHEKEGDRIKMERKETELLSKINKF